MLRNLGQPKSGNYNTVYFTLSKVQKRYKEYDGCYLGHYAQWFFWFFFVLGFFIFTAAIVMMVGKWCNWF